MFRLAVVVLFLSTGVAVHGQTKKSIATSTLWTVQVPDTVMHLLLDNSITKAKIHPPDNFKPSVSVYNLLHPDSLIFTDGVYRYRLDASHSLPLIFIRRQGSIQLFNSQDCDGLIDEFREYTQRTPMKEQEKLHYLKAIVTFLNFLDHERTPRPSK